MALPDTPKRVRYLFIMVMVGHMLLISTQVTSRSGAPLIQAALVAAFTEAQRAAWVVVNAGRQVWDGYVALRGVRADNQRLTREVTDLRVQIEQERTASQASGQMRTLLDLRARAPWKSSAAEVIGGGVSPELRSIVIDRGQDSSFRRDMPVMSGAGLVGRIMLAGPHASTVQLIVDQSAAAAVIVERSRAQGVVLGVGDGTLRLDYLAPSADVQRGDQVSTAGVDGVYPKGIVVGIVDRVDRAARVVIVRPAVDFARLEYVLIVVDPVPLPAVSGSVPAAAKGKQ